MKKRWIALLFAPLILAGMLLSTALADVATYTVTLRVGTGGTLQLNGTTVKSGEAEIPVTNGETLTEAMANSGYTLKANGGYALSKLVSGLSVVDVQLSESTQFLLLSDGTVWGVGHNTYGQLGNGTFTDTLQYTQAIDSTGKPMTDVTAIAAGKYHTALLKSDGTVWASGWNQYGQLGNGTNTNSACFVQMQIKSAYDELMMTTAQSVAVGDDFTVVANRDSNNGQRYVYATGHNNKGQLGLGDTTDVNKLSTKYKITNAASVSAGPDFAVVLTTSNYLYSTGSNESGKLGQGKSSAVEEYVTAYALMQQATSSGSTSSFHDVAQVACGSSHVIALKNDGTVWGVGNGSASGVTSYTWKTFEPVEKAPKKVAKIFAGGTLNAAIDKNGTATTWGYGTGIDATIEQVKMMACSRNSALILKEDDISLSGFGNNDYGQLGTGNTDKCTVYTPAKTDAMSLQIPQTFRSTDDITVTGDMKVTAVFRTHKSHCVCGDESCSGTNRNETGHSMISNWSSTKELKYTTKSAYGWTYADCLTAGNYYLTDDVTLDSDYYVESGTTVRLCLNGHTLNFNNNHIQVYGTLLITNCDDVETGRISKGWCSTFHLLSGGNLTLNRVVVDGGRAVSNDYSRGGAVANYSGTFTAADSVFTNNSCRFEGGAVYNRAGTVTLTRCTFENNGETAGSNEKTQTGGAVYSQNGSLTVTDCVFRGNKAADTSGAIYVLYGDDTFQMTGTVITENSADRYGGLYFSGKRAALKDCEITNNTATSTDKSMIRGGGISLGYGKILFSGRMVVTGNTAGGEANNVELSPQYNDYYETYRAYLALNGALEEGSQIGLRNVKYALDEYDGALTFRNSSYAPTEKDFSYFTNDDEQWVKMTKDVENGTILLEWKHTHTLKSDWTVTDTAHWHVCTNTNSPYPCQDDYKVDYSKHDCTRQVVDAKYLASEATCTSAKRYYRSCKCGVKGTWTFTDGNALGHLYDGYEHDETQHWQVCTREDCGYTTAKVNHTGGTATCTKAAVCSTCKETYGSLDATNHNLTFFVAVPVTCTEDGNDAYWYCEDCQKYFADKDGEADMATAYDSAAMFAHAKLSHKDAVKTEAQAATCTEGGHEAYWYCAACGQYFADKDGVLDATAAYDSAVDFNTDPLNHAGAKRTAAKAATCTQGGHDAYWHCADCGLYFADKNGELDPDLGGESADDFNTAPLHHKDAVKTPAQAATCTKDGNDAYWHCPDCGKYFADKNGALDDTKAYDSAAAFTRQKIGHKNAVKTVAQAATCTQGGHDAYWHCADCGKYFADKNGALDAATAHDSADDFNTDPLHHAGAKRTAAKAATCTQGGHDAYWYCADCGKYFADKNGALDAATAHDSADDFNTYPLHHKNAVRTAAQAETCTKDGNDAYWNCPDCGKYFADKNSALDDTKAYDSAASFTRQKIGHKNAVKTKAQAATCTQGGHDAYWHCPDCGKYFADKNGALDAATAHDSAEDFNTDPLNHAGAKRTVAQAETCTGGGHKAYWYCADCGKYFADKNGVLDAATAYDSADAFGIAPLHHKDAVRTAAQAETCTKDGNDAYWNCADCGKYFADKNSALDDTKAYDSAASFTRQKINHKNAVKTKAQAATCTQGGHDAYWNCPDCGKYFADKNGALDGTTAHDSADDFNTKKLGHLFTDYKYNKDATYDADGTETAVCDRDDCHATDTRTKAGSKLIDTEDPVVSGVENNHTYCLSVTVSVEDVNLSEVTLNGKAVTLTDGKLAVGPAEGRQTLVAADRFGNTITVVFTVNAEHSFDEGMVTVPATAAKEGTRTFTCTVCGETKTQSIDKTTPTLSEGNNTVYEKNSGKTLRFGTDAAKEDFLRLTVDGKEVGADQYLLGQDGVTVTLSTAYLETLSVGEHTLEITSVSGTATAKFSVKAAPAAPGQPIPPTGDSSQTLIVCLSLALFGGLMMLVLVGLKKRRNG